MVVTLLRYLNEGVMDAAALAAGLCALGLAHPLAREKAAAWWETVDKLEPARMVRFVWLATAAVATWLLLLKTWQFLAFQLHQDTATNVNAASDLLHGYGLASVEDGTPNVLSVHFAFLVPVFLAPLLFACRSALPFVLVQTAIVASTGPAAYLLTRRRTGSAVLGLALMGLTWSHISFHELVTANLENSVFAPALMLWGLVLWDDGRRFPAGTLWALALTTREQFPFTLAGLGVYHALSSQAPRRRRIIEGAGIVAASAAMWFLEMRLVASFADHLNDRVYWTRYAQFGASRQKVVRTILLRPDLVLRQMFWPPSHLAPLALLAAGLAFLPFADPAAAACLVVASVHHLLLPRYTFYDQDASYTFGPLVFAAACGLAALARSGRLTPARRSWLLAALLGTAGANLFYAPRTVAAREPGDGFVDEAPALVRLIPPTASVWADRKAAVRLAARPQLKIFWFSKLSPRFDVMLFRPEFVLAQKAALLTLAASDQERVVAFLAREGYEKVAESQSLLLLRDPKGPRNGPSPNLELSNRSEDRGLIGPYLARVLDSPQARARLASYPPDLRFAPETAEQHALFGEILDTRGLTDLAIRHNRAALKLRPDYVAAYTNLGSELARKGDLPGAEVQLRQALRLEPSTAIIAYNLGNILIQERKATEAVTVLAPAAQSAPSDPRLLNSLGAAYLLAGRRPEARAAFERALALDPRLIEARENLRGL